MYEAFYFPFCFFRKNMSAFVKETSSPLKKPSFAVDGWLIDLRY